MPPDLETINRLKVPPYVSDTPYILPPSGELGDGADEDLRVYDERTYGCIILFDILGEETVVGYGENTYKHIDMRNRIQSPSLYHMIHYFNVSLEELLEAHETGFYGSSYDEELLRAMFLPYEEMLEYTMNGKGAYLNGTVYNIQTLNQLFVEDKETFSQISLNELIRYQERLEENGINYGFNQDMVDFAKQNCAWIYPSSSEELLLKIKNASGQMDPSIADRERDMVTKNNIIFICSLIFFFICFLVRVNVAPDTSKNKRHGTAESKPSLHVSNTPYTIPPSGKLGGLGNNEALHIYHSRADNCIILFDVLGKEAVEEYGKRVSKYRDMRDIIQSPELYHMINHFNVSLEDLLEAYETGSYGSSYDEELLRAMFLPYEEMLAFTMNEKGAFLNGTVYNIQTLNQLFKKDKKTFSKISLTELAEYQKRLEGCLIDYGFNEDMVDFAIENCVRTDASPSEK